MNSNEIQNIIKYIRVIELFIEKRINANKFEEEFLLLHRNDTNLYSEEIGEIISTLFSDIDAFCGDESIANYSLDNPFRDITEVELRERSLIAFNNLKQHI